MTSARREYGQGICPNCDKSFVRYEARRKFCSIKCANAYNQAPRDRSGFDMSWRPDGACNDMDPNLFFPRKSNPQFMAVIKQAKAVCASCPVRAKCLDYALEAHEVYGIWGGTTEHERRPMRRRRLRDQVA